MYFCGSIFHSTLNSINMSKLRVLYVASEINPFLQTSEVADFVRKLPQAMQERGMEIRILVPRFGIINERKNRLHEVVRLSGINIAVGDEEKPLIIKVASIPNAKLQVYFIDNEDYFHRKSVFHDKENKFYEDNVLIDQPFVKDPSKTIGELVAEKIASIKENITIRRFSRFKMGEGIEKRADDFAAEVASMIG